MPLALHTYADSHCEGRVIEILDKDLLARALAYVLLQRYQSAIGIARSLPTPVPAPPPDVEDIIQRRLRNPPPEHRDGLLFQLIVWLAAASEAGPNDIVLPPQIGTAEKGIDGVIVHVTSTDGIAAVSICEDKATTRPRETVRSEVWPAIEDFEKDGRLDLLRGHVISALLARRVAPAAAETSATEIIWQQSRRYRVRVTVGDTHAKPSNRRNLFKGYSRYAPGAPARRRGETLHLTDLRAWMDDFAGRIEQHLRAL